ncbi:unnamed protein product [Urochloa humidicola]
MAASYSALNPAPPPPPPHSLATSHDDDLPLSPRSVGGTTSGALSLYKIVVLYSSPSPKISVWYRFGFLFYWPADGESRWPAAT